MERRIKLLYIITIVAILAFLGMQAYWLYGRYEFSLSEYDSYASAKIVEAVDNLGKLGKNRRVNWAEKDGEELAHRSNYNINHHTDSAGRKRITATIRSQKYFAHKLLGITERRELTPEESQRAALMVLENETLAETRRQSYDASNAPSDAAVWGAFERSEAEFLAPLTTGMVDSVLRMHGLDADIRLVVTDTMVWQPSVIHHASAVSPTTVISVPYSELECKSVVVTCHIPVSKIFHDMTGTLVVVALLSLFLIICLILQFATILKLSRLDRMRNSFITTMIHELKRPISTFKMCVSGLENKRMMEDQAVRKELLSETRNALDNLSAYFSRLRDITFNDVEQIPLNIRSVNLHELFESVAGATAVPSGKAVVIKNEIAPAVEVSADRTHIYNVVSNLVENAVKYSGPSVEITAEAAVDGANVVLRISDTGNGISPADLRHIFKRFYRGQASGGDQPGMGLGLAYARLLVEAHGGDISVASKEGEGTCFTIRLPQ